MIDLPAIELLPHRPPMLLVEGILEVDEENQYILASARCSSHDLLYDSKLNGVQPMAAVEIQAQAIGLFCGYSDKLKGRKPASMGKLLSIKHYKAHVPVLPIEAPLQVEARGVLHTPPVGVFACKICCGEQLLAESEITVLRED